MGDAASWAQEMELTLPVLADTDGTFYDVWDPEGVLPVTYIVDPAGVVVFGEAQGTESLEALEAQIIELLPND